MKKPTINDATKYKGDLAKWDYLLPDEVNRLFPKAELDAMAEDTGLELCFFREGCDLCEGNYKGEDFRRRHPIGRIWARIRRGECAEADFYCCDACLPEKYLEQVRQAAAWTGDRPCLCRDKGGTFKTVRNEWGCAECFGMGMTFLSLRPYPVRAEMNFLHAMHRAEVTTGRRQRHWRRSMRRWFREAVRECGAIKQKTPPPRSIGTCERCKKRAQRPWLDMFRRYGSCCLSCSWLNLCEGLDVDPVTMAPREGGEDGNE